LRETNYEFLIPFVLGVLFTIIVRMFYDCSSTKVKGE